MITETLPEHVTDRDSWTDYVQSQGKVRSDGTATSTSDETEPERRPDPRNNSFDKKGLTRLAEMGYLRPGDLTGTTDITVDERQIGVEIVLLDIGTKRYPDQWSLVIPTDVAERGIFLPKRNLEE